MLKEFLNQLQKGFDEKNDVIKAGIVRIIVLHVNIAKKGLKAIYIKDLSPF